MCFQFNYYRAVSNILLVTHLNVVPPIALQLLNNPLAAGGDFSSLVCLMNAAAPLEQSLADRLCEKLDCVLTQWYGLTEASPSVISQKEDQVHVRNTVGKILPGITVKIIDESNRGQLIRLRVAGSNTYKDYRMSTWRPGRAVHSRA